jgi:triosephosphate isomerase
MPRRKIIAGNWKMNKLPNEAMDFITNISDCANNVKCEVILCVPYTDLFYSLLTAQKTKIKIGAQNMHWEEKGAYTGEISGEMLKCINVEYVIIGHSERRMYFAETDETVNKKVKSAFKYGLNPIICVGETLEQKNNGKTNEIITNQTMLALEGLNSEQVKNIIIAYEPIWAIGTGVVATSNDANDSIKQIRNKIKEIYGEDVANQVSILYGGSVKSSNAKEIFETSDIDGALVGGASLDVKEFENIIRAI